MEEKNKFVRARADVGRRKQVEIFFGSFLVVWFSLCAKGEQGRTARG